MIRSNGSQKSGEHVFQFIIKDIIKETEEQPGDEVHRERSGKGQYRSLCPSGVGVFHPPAYGCIHPPRRSPSSEFKDFYGDFIMQV